jgi:type II secretory pathway component HofQ
MKTLAALILTAAAAFAGDSREDAARKLEAKISVDFRGVKLSAAIAVFRDATGLNFVVEEGSETLVRLTLKDVSAKSALRLILQPAGLGAAIEHGVVVIRSRQSLAGAVTLRIYDVRNMMVKLKDFPGPRVELGGRAPGGLFGFG